MAFFSANVRLAWMVVLLMASTAGAAQCNKMIVSADPAYPPLHWYDGSSLQGASVEIARRVLVDAGIPYEMRYLGPFPRVMAAAERGEVDMVTTLKRTTAREQFLVFPDTPALPNPIVVFVERSRVFAYKGREDLIGHYGGFTRGNRFSEEFDAFARTSLKFEEANTPEESFNKLGLGRIDYFVTGLHTGMAYLLKRRQEDRFLVLSPYIADTPNYIALTKNGHCADQVDAINRSLQKLKARGELDAVLGASLQQWRARPVLE